MNDPQLELEKSKLAKHRAKRARAGNITPAIAAALQARKKKAAAPVRNAPCPCGSGKKFKRCCEYLS